MSSNVEKTGHMSSNDSKAADFFAKMSWDVKRTCPGHVLCPQMCPQIFQRTGRAIARQIGNIGINKTGRQESRLVTSGHDNYMDTEISFIFNFCGTTP